MLLMFEKEMKNKKEPLYENWASLQLAALFLHIILSHYFFCRSQAVPVSIMQHRAEPRSPWMRAQPPAGHPTQLLTLTRTLPTKPVTQTGL